MSPFRILVAASLVLAPLAARAQLTPEKVAEIRHAQKAALEKVDAAHGHRKPGEMDNDERRQVIEEQSAAAQSALDEAGVSAKEYTGYAIRMSREEQAAAKAAEQKLETRDRAEKKAAGEEEQAEVQIQQGFSEQDPVELEQREGAGPRVDYGDDAAGQSPESGASSETAESAETAESDGSAPAPAKAKTSRSKGHQGGRGRR